MSSGGISVATVGTLCLAGASPLAPPIDALSLALPGLLAMSQSNARLGLILFVIYLALYGGFVGLAAFAPDVMERTPAAGVNLAIWYGFGLIAAAILLALIYGWLCRRSNEPGRPAPGAPTHSNDKPAVR
jgi:uncharacterized membrane protein (DUF485 family)